MARKVTTAKSKPTKKAPARVSSNVTAKPAEAEPKQTARGQAAKAASSVPAPGRAKPAAAKAKVAPPAPKPVTVTLKHLAAELSESRGMPKRDAEAFAADLIGGLLEQVKAGAKVRIPGLGAIEIKDRPARMARNPATGAPVQVEASRKIVFRAAKELKDAI